MPLSSGPGESWRRALVAIFDQTLVFFLSICVTPHEQTWTPRRIHSSDVRTSPHMHVFACLLNIGVFGAEVAVWLCATSGDQQKTERNAGSSISPPTTEFSSMGREHPANGRAHWAIFTLSLHLDFILDIKVS